MKKIIALGNIWFFMLFVACEHLYPDDSFSLKQTPYNGNELRIDGYYYHYSPIITDPYEFHAYFYYKNGVSLYTNAGHTFESMADDIKNNIQYYKEKEYWGLFTISNGIISIEHSVGTTRPNVPVYVEKGIILNDTTFRITSSYRSNGSEWVEKYETYHFHAFSPKPDSANFWFK